MKFDTLAKRIDGLENAACAGKTKTTDDNGQVIWIEGSCLKFIRRVMAFGNTLDREPRLEDLPEDLRLEARLWSRAELPECGLSDMLRGVLSELGMIEIDARK
jgi:hypothetical protein